MTERNYEFTVLRIVPNAMRGERVNVGIAVFDADGTVSIKLDTNKNRLCSFDPNLSAINWDDWQAQARQTLAAIPAASRTYWLTHGLHPVVADEKRGVFRADRDSYEDRVDDLLRRLVATPAREVRAQRRVLQRTGLHAQWKGWFKAQRIMGRGIEDMERNQIVESYPVSEETSTFAEFAFRNGALHIMETLDLRNIDHLTQRQLNTAAFKSIVLDEARPLVAGGGRRIAVISATDYDAVRPAIKMVERMADDVVMMESADDVARLVRQIGNALHRTDELDSARLLA